MTKECSQTYYLAAGECNPEKEMPLTLLMTRVIEIATLHANSWGVGYERLIQDNQAWVLSRVTIEMEAYPQVNTRYTVTTWIEDYNRHFSQRNMAVTDEQGRPLGYVRTIWMVIDLTSRASVDISKLGYISENVSERRCPIEPQTRLRPVSGGRVVDYTFGYADCDFNRHVNTVRYLEHLMNLFDLHRYDTQFIQRMEISFLRESHYGDTVTIHVDESQALDSRMSMAIGGEDHVRARFVWRERLAQ